MDTQKQAGLWGKVKDLWRKWTGGQEYQGPSASEDQVLDAFADDFVRNFLWTLGPIVIRQAVVEGNKAGIPPEYMPYLFWLWNEGRSSWPEMAADKYLGLKVAKDLTKAQRSMPNYRPVLKIPPPELEPQIDKALSSLALWAATKMLILLMEGYDKFLGKWTPAMARAVGPTLPKNKAGIYLQLFFEDSVRRQSGQFLSGALLDDVILGLFP